MAAYPVLRVDRPSLVCILLTSMKRVLVGLGILVIGGVGIADDWPMFQHDRMHTGKSRDVGPNSDSVYWKGPFEADGQIWTPPVGGVIGETPLIYIGTQRGSLYAIYTDESGNPREKWSFHTPHKSIWGGVAVDPLRRRVYFGSGNDSLYALDALTGDTDTLWIDSLKTYLTTPITLEHPYLYFGIAHYLYVLEDRRYEADSEFIYYTGDEVIDGCAPAVDDTGTVYFQSASNLGDEPCYLHILSADGTEADWVVLGGKSSPALRSDTIYIGSKDGYIYLITRTEEGWWEKVRWREIGRNIESSPAIGNDGRMIYIGSDDGHIYCWIPSEDSLISFPPTNGPIVAAPILDNEDNVYVGSQDSCFYSFTPDGKFRWKYETKDKIRHPAAMVDGVAYVASGRYLYAFGRGTIGVEERPSKLCSDFHICPNPSTSVMKMSVSLTREDNIELGIYSASGVLIKTLFKGYKGKGDHQIVWDGRNMKGEEVPTGVYFCRFSTPSSYYIVEKIIMVR